MKPTRIQEAANEFVMQVCNVTSDDFDTCGVNVKNLINSMKSEFPEAEWLNIYPSDKCFLNGLYSTHEQELTVERLVEALLLYSAVEHEINEMGAGYMDVFPNNYYAYMNFTHVLGGTSILDGL